MTDQDEPTPPPPDPTLADLAEEALARCAVLGHITEEPGRLTRTFLGPATEQVHGLLAGWMIAAGMAVRLDAAGNLIGRYPAASGRDDTPAVVIGSHVDTVPDAGKYDGMLGVALGMASVRALGGRRLPFAVEVVGFSEEEGVRYRTPYLGSRALVGRFDPALLDLTDGGGVPMAEAFRGFGLDPARVGAAASPPGRIRAYLEAHIEQGPVLEDADLPVGVVTAIAGQSRLLVSFEGRAGHAGTTPMESRRDALTAAAEWVLAVEARGRAVPGLRATVGTITALPGATNVIPGTTALSLDVRHERDEARLATVDGLLSLGVAIALRRGLEFQLIRNQDLPAVAADPALGARLAAAVRAAGVEPLSLVSGAGHDAAIVAEIAPMALLFVRSPGGISHHPDESVIPGDVRVALDVMVRWLDGLARDDSPLQPRTP